MEEKAELTRNQKIARRTSRFLIITTIVFALYILYRYVPIDVVVIQNYFPTALSAKLLNLILFFGSIIIYDLSLDPPGLVQVQIMDDPENRWKFFCVLMACVSYILSLT